ncbi:hypothetical protein [Dysgonomonas massiliensis]|uniref:hypothetical protein n=1 Tax=Dysgonomonas massiliensis TaxID=2040292 RepID=UPI000C75D707|nr:hypothetical protein [Dysgonomonas massiliensis]
MEQKIIRISAPLHQEYKELVSRFPNLTLSSSTEILIRQALKRGEIEKNEKTAYDAVKALNETFRKWMRQQEKTHLTRISEELLALAHELKDTTTKKDLETQSKNISTSFKESYEDITEALSINLDNIKSELIKSIDELKEVVDTKLTKKMFG